MSHSTGSHDSLTVEQVDAYLVRIGLQPALIRARPCDLALLETLQYAHMISVPWDNVAVHLKDDSDQSDEPIVWRDGPGYSHDVQGAFDRIVGQGRGGVCFPLNVALAALLRGLGFSLSQGLSELTGPTQHCARSPAPHTVGKNPDNRGLVWWKAHHVVNLVRIGEDTYMVDVGYGSVACARPISLSQVDPIDSFLGDRFSARQEALPYAPSDDEKAPKGWTVYRHYANGVVAPSVHIFASPVYPPDLKMMLLSASAGAHVF